jgi:hypothetical protein
LSEYLLESRARALRETRIETASDQPSWENVMATDFAPTFLACGGIFLLSFFMIWAFWFVERLRGASAPQLGK